MNFHRLFDILPYQQARFPNKIALSQRQGTGWATFSPEQCLQEINRVSAGLLRLGIQKGDHIAILARIGSPKWLFFDQGVQQIGAVLVPLHASLSEQDLTYIFRETAAKICLTADAELYKKTSKLQALIPTLQHLFCFESVSTGSNWQDLLQEPDEQQLAQIQIAKNTITENELATIIYTSGTTGEPKGVMLSHKNIVSNIKSIIPLVPVNYTHTSFSFLPLSHIFERMVVYSYIAVGATVHFAERRETALHDLQQAQPHYFTAVPKILERVYDTLLQQANQKPRLIRLVMRWAMKLGERYDETKRLPMPDFWFQWLLADLLVYHWWRRQLGGRVQGVIVGAAALRPKLGKLFSAAGIPIREGYGLTETSPVVAFNRFEPGGVRFGTVGISIPGVEIKIDRPNEKGEGEILVKGSECNAGLFSKSIGNKIGIYKRWLAAHGRYWVYCASAVYKNNGPAKRYF